jgi:hypothetical protein
MDYSINKVEESFNVNLGRDLKAILKSELSKTEKEKKYTKHIKLSLTSTGFDRKIRDYIWQDLKAKVLFFGMWTNNPTWAKIKLLDCIQTFMPRFNYLSEDPSTWRVSWPQDFGNEFEKTLRETRVKYWGEQVAKEDNRESRTRKILDCFYSLTRNIEF